MKYIVKTTFADPTGHAEALTTIVDSKDLTDFIAANRAAVIELKQYTAEKVTVYFYIKRDSVNGKSTISSVNFNWINDTRNIALRNGVKVSKLFSHEVEIEL
jgi:hypothetical protein